VKDPIVVWIVEDEILPASQAWKEVSLVSSQFPGEVQKYWASDTSWEGGPALRSGVNLALTPDERSGYPDLVILDLMFGTENAQKFLGGVFHERLRRWEAHKPKPGKPAFVVLWSVHQGALATEEFVRTAVSSDPRVIETGSKRPELLKPKLRQLWRRIIEEREDMIE
jgi:hypothetical protein